MRHTIHNLCIVLILGVAACTPGTTEQAQTTKPPAAKGKPTASTDPCATFKDSKAGEAALDAHVIYRDFIKREQYEQAIPYWKQAFNAAPAADGQRTTHFDDGAKIYEYLLSQQTTREAKLTYLDSVFYMYDRSQRCYPENTYVDGKKAFDLYYNYRDLADNHTIFQYFTKVFDEEGLETPAFVVNPFTALLLEMFTAKEIDQQTAVKYAKQILEITNKHAALIETAPCDMNLKYEETTTGACTGTDAQGNKTPVENICCELAQDIAEGWPIVIGYAPAQLDVFETIKGFYDCAYFKEKYFLSVNVDSVHCDDIPLIYAQLRRGGCPETDPSFTALLEEHRQRCTVTTMDSSIACGAKALEDEDYEQAIRCYKDYIARSQDPEKRAKYNLFVSKIYYQIRNFSKAREHARFALRDEPGLGEAYLLIGKLYASSGPLCGPGRGWDSQIVTWPAIDMFQRARQDRRVAAEANKLISTYSRYMPTVEDIFQRQLAEGQSFFVACWIQENTTIRAAR